MPEYQLTHLGEDATFSKEEILGFRATLDIIAEVLAAHGEEFEADVANHLGAQLEGGLGRPEPD
jgi:hypothetical protein